ncbi:MAG: hypothetical protein ACT4NV_20330, partial [Rhodoferax sp.]
IAQKMGNSLSDSLGSAMGTGTSQGATDWGASLGQHLGHITAQAAGSMVGTMVANDRGHITQEESDSAWIGAVGGVLGGSVAEHVKEQQSLRQQERARQDFRRSEIAQQNATPMDSAQQFFRGSEIRQRNDLARQEAVQQTAGMTQSFADRMRADFERMVGVGVQGVQGVGASASGPVSGAQAYGQVGSGTFGMDGQSDVLPGEGSGAASYPDFMDSAEPWPERQGPRTYTVREGDNPARIGRAFFGDERAGAAIMAHSGLNASVRGARALQVGQVLTIPENLSEANLRAGGQLIGMDSAIRAQEAAARVPASTVGGMSGEEISERYFANGVGRYSPYQTEQAIATQRALDAGGRFESVDSYDPVTGMPNGGSEPVWVSNKAPTPYAQSVAQAAQTAMQLGVGAGELLASGLYNQGVRIAAGVVSIPYAALDGVDAAVAVQQSMQEARGWTPRSEGAQAIATMLAPVGQALGEASNRVRARSEHYLGDATTSVLGAAGQFALEAGGTAGGLMAAGKALENTVFVTRPTAGLYGGIPVDALFGTTRITTVTAEMSDAFQGMGYIHPLTNKFTVAPLGETMAVDHIFPSAEIVKMQGFNTLTKPQMTSIIQDTTGELGNLQPLPKSFNSSKGSSTNWTEYKGQTLDPGYATTLEQTQRAVRLRILDQIKIYQQLNLRNGH